MTGRDDLVAASAMVSAFESLRVRYAIGGSAASSLHGMPRSTADVDMIAEIGEEHVGRLADLLAPSFYVDADAIRDAVRRRASFNAIHLGTMYKVDVFVVDDRGSSELDRAQSARVFGPGSPEFKVAAPEDVVAAKLGWYRDGGEVSERQWLDVLGVLRVTGADLDLELLSSLATSRGVLDLLERARREAGR